MPSNWEAMPLTSVTEACNLERQCHRHEAYQGESRCPAICMYVLGKLLLSLSPARQTANKVLASRTKHVNELFRPAFAASMSAMYWSKISHCVTVPEQRRAFQGGRKHRRKPLNKGRQRCRNFESWAVAGLSTSGLVASDSSSGQLAH